MYLFVFPLVISSDVSKLKLSLPSSGRWSPLFKAWVIAYTSHSKPWDSIGMWPEGWLWPHTHTPWATNAWETPPSPHSSSPLASHFWASCLICNKTFWHAIACQSHCCETSWGAPLNIYISDLPSILSIRYSQMSVIDMCGVTASFRSHGVKRLGTQGKAPAIDTWPWETEISFLPSSSPFLPLPLLPLMNLDLASQVTDSGTELTSAHMVSGCHDPQIGYLMWGVKARNKKVLRHSPQLCPSPPVVSVLSQ